jgi:hypothetical protein
LDRAVKAAQVSPDIAPLMSQMLLFGVRGFKAGRELEGVIEQFTQQMQDKLKQPQQQQPNPDVLKLQAEQQKDQAEMQFKMQQAQAELQMTMQKHQAELQSQMQIETMKQEYESVRQRERIAADLEIARFNSTIEAAKVVADVNQISGGLNG